MVAFGYKPFSLAVNLAADSDFIQMLVAFMEWPGGTVIELRFFDDAGAQLGLWPATISGPQAMWDVPRAVVAAMIALDPREVRLFYIDVDDDELLWGKGRPSIV